MQQYCHKLPTQSTPLITETKISKSMNNENTVFQTEVQAVQHVVTTINPTLLKTENIKIRVIGKISPKWSWMPKFKDNSLI